MTVLLIGYDEHIGNSFVELEQIESAVIDRGGNPTVIHCDDWPGESPVTSSIKNGVWEFGDTTVHTNEVTGAFHVGESEFWPTLPRHLDSFKQNPVGSFHTHAEYQTFFRDLYFRLSEKGANLIPDRPLRTPRKVERLHRLKEANMQIPDTVVTSSGEIITEFYEEYDRAIVKPLSAPVRLKEVTEEELEKADFSKSAPMQVQEFIEGIDIRVHVIGGQAVAASQIEKDWVAYEGQNEENTTLIDCGEVGEVAEQAVEAVGREVGTVDLIRNPDRGYFVLEVNDIGRWGFIEEKLGADVSGAIAEYLLTGSVSR